MGLCDFCQHVDLVKLSQNWRDGVRFFQEGEGGCYYDLNWDIRKPDMAVLYHHTVEELLASTVACDLCSAIRSEVQRSVARMEEAGRDGEFWTLDGHAFWMCGMRGGVGVQVVAINEEDCLSVHLICAFRFCVDEDSKLSQIIDGRTHPVSPTDPAALRMIDRWLGETRDQASSAPTSRRLPTRLLKIADEGAKVSLVTLNDENPRYAALSHCWGSVQPTTLTKDSQSLLLAGVETSSLPQSFQDAIWLCHRLGVRFLWIDSLCILQDSLQDWEHESAKMRDVYENAYFTIAASRASSSGEGFLGDQNHCKSVPIAYDAGGYSYSFSALLVPLKHVDHIDRRVYLENEPLTSRGWVLQERFISRRTIHFARSQILLEHGGLMTTQDCCTPVRIGSYNAMSNLDGRNWYTVVEMFSTRKLTVESDKLPALGALATYFSDAFCNGKDSLYLAGLWREDMLRGLCWLHDLGSPPARRPRSYRAPSWSWAAIDGYVRLPALGAPEIKLAIIEDAHTDLASPKNPFGEVKGGWVRLRAILLQPRNNRYRSVLSEKISFREGEVDFHMLFPRWDAESYLTEVGTRDGDAADGKSSIWFIPMGYYEPTTDTMRQQAWFRTGPFCLIVKPVEHTISRHSDLRGFQRVGSGSFETDDEETAKQLYELMSGEWTEIVVGGRLEEIILI